mmetsp:Transcript_6698/g.11502  ORF Transcript_6698/g.11502 Transcript_6698/m.11502 type:complete len:117 (+) Transcript_6698:77-427(+)
MPPTAIMVSGSLRAESTIWSVMLLTAKPDRISARAIHASMSHHGTRIIRRTAECGSSRESFHNTNQSSKTRNHAAEPAEDAPPDPSWCQDQRARRWAKQRTMSSTIHYMANHSSKN